jgi:undecaprenyl-diphosphatase
MNEVLQTIFLGLLQGVAELFPISSLGHTVLIPALLGWSSFVNSDNFLSIVVTLHLGTAAALVLFYWRDWYALVRAFFKTAIKGRLDADPMGKTIWLLIVGTIPVALLGLFLETPLKKLFASPVIVAAFLCANGAVLLLGEMHRRRVEPKGADRAEQEERFATINDLSFQQAFLIGFTQSFALLPGISRSGVTMVASLRAKLSHEEALRFTFLLATPVILLAGLLEVPKLISTKSHFVSQTTQIAAAAGGIAAFVAALLSVTFLSRYFKIGRLTPFAIYCFIAGLIGFFLFAGMNLGWFTLPWMGH